MKLQVLLEDTYIKNFLFILPYLACTLTRSTVVLSKIRGESRGDRAEMEKYI